MTFSFTYFPVRVIMVHLFWLPCKLNSLVPGQWCEFKLQVGGAKKGSRAPIGWKETPRSIFQARNWPVSKGTTNRRLPLPRTPNRQWLPLALGMERTTEGQYPRYGFHSTSRASERFNQWRRPRVLMMLMKQFRMLSSKWNRVLSWLRFQDNVVAAASEYSGGCCECNTWYNRYPYRKDTESWRIVPTVRTSARSFPRIMRAAIK